MHIIQARVKLSDRTNQVLNIVKAKYNLKDKSAALDLVVAQYEEKILESQYRPEFIKEMLDSENDEVIGPFENANELKAYIESLPDEDE
ncbi:MULTISPECIES: DUF2683 family protein [Methanosarcina]|uniref:Antitoxin n=2 Tax=Methanosarcina barkeri TaxID=2208 RepID=A0A0E3QQR4_METBA|nr:MULTISPECIES: DUF2683 family protein [Methanosarcina]AKB53053.1 hypothetical protein MSBRM_0055 [Methanosarcina barkeri MS]AKB56570.1 hypothetical protein MSBR2_0054 [Methanosarcina barkeri 227]OED02663.1 hypothetical protein A9239_01620 [Methanosarcina sp. A14]